EIGLLPNSQLQKLDLISQFCALCTVLSLMPVTFNLWQLHNGLSFLKFEICTIKCRDKQYNVNFLHQFIKLRPPYNRCIANVTKAFNTGFTVYEILGISQKSEYFLENFLDICKNIAPKC
ncbi:unnamed protein product, partial [Owenia fusiformis]